jgi:hypothetical protein
LFFPRDSLFLLSFYLSFYLPFSSRLKEVLAVYDNTSLQYMTLFTKYHAEKISHSRSVSLPARLPASRCFFLFSFRRSLPV